MAWRMVTSTGSSSNVVGMMLEGLERLGAVAFTWSKSRVVAEVESIRGVLEHCAIAVIANGQARLI